MNIPDETLMAYVDDELDAITRAQVDHALAIDPQLAARLARQRAVVAQLRAVFDSALEEPLPPHLLATLRSSDNTAATDSRPRTRRGTRTGAVPVRRWSWPQWGALAASLVVGVLAGYVLPRPAPDGLAARNGELLARGPLAKALSEQLASAPEDPTAPLRVGLSFRAKTGDYCRTFTLASTGEPQPLAGLACKHGPDWRIHTLARAQAAGSGDYRMAASAMPEAVLRVVDANIDGDPLDASAEQAARNGGWRP